MNSRSGFDAFAMLNEARRGKQARSIQGGENQELSIKITYQKVLEWTQNKISESEQYTRVLQECLKDEAKGGEQLKGIIYKLLQNYPNALDQTTIESFHVRIFEDMSGLGLLTKWLDDPFVEEINVYGPGPRQIEILTSNRGTFLLDDGFPDAETVLNTAKRMVRKGNMTLDMSNPRVDSYMGGGTRVSAMIYPIIREDKGAVISIRKQTKARIKKGDLISSKTAMPEELAFLELCARNKVSGAIVGSTGSGKTTLLNYMMTHYVTVTDEARVYIIEESRELQLPDDAKVIYTASSGDEKGGVYVTAQDLLKSSLRFHPTFISCAEMRGAEAMNAMTAAQTGHIVWSTFHADNCIEAYQRLLTMCKMSGTDLSEQLLLRNLVAAFPIMASTQQLKDGTRKITGIYEAEGVDGTTVIGHYIYRMVIDRYDYDTSGRVTHIEGAHCRVGDLSDRMAQRIFDNCGRIEDIQYFARAGWKPERPGGTNQMQAGNAIPRAELRF